MKDRIGEPTPLASLLQDAEAACRRITGRTVEEWSEFFRERRAASYRSGHFRGGVMLQTMSEGALAKMEPGQVTEVDAYCRRYGLDEPDDLEFVRFVPIQVVVNNRKAAGLPFPRIPSGGKVPCETLTVYRVNPEKYPR